MAYIGAGAIAKSMATATHHLHQFEQGFAYGLDEKHTAGFAKDIKDTLGYDVQVCKTAEEAVRAADVIFTQVSSSPPS